MLKLGIKIKILLENGLFLTCKDRSEANPAYSTLWKDRSEANLFIPQIRKIETERTLFIPQNGKIEAK